MDPVAEAAKNRAKTTASKASRQALFAKSKKGKGPAPDPAEPDVDDAAHPKSAPIKKGRTN